MAAYLIPVAEAARLARIPARTIYDWARQGKVAGRKVGRRQLLHVDYAQVCDLLQRRGPGGRLIRLPQLT